MSLRSKELLLSMLSGIVIGVSSCWLYNHYISSNHKHREAYEKNHCNTTTTNTKRRKKEKRNNSPATDINTTIVQAPMKDATRTSPVPLSYISVGAIKSCFASCRGTPRQGFLMPTAKAQLVLHSDISEHTLEGISSYSHLWLLFHFHKNKIPKDKTTTAKQRAGLQKRKRPRFKAKINPPKLKDGTKVGVFSARTPHRPNAIGLTLVKLESVDMKKKILTISGVDLVHGTPVVDIKPYVPHYDSVPEATVPQWVNKSLSEALLKVELSDAVKNDMMNYLNNRQNTTSASVGSERRGGGNEKSKKKLKHNGSESNQLYTTIDEMTKAVIEMLQLDMNSGTTANKVQHEKRMRGNGDGKSEDDTMRVFYASLDGFKLTCHWYEEEQKIVVVGGVRELM